MPNYQASKKHISNWGQIVLVLFAWDVLQKPRLNTIPQCGWILYVAHRPLCGQILDLKKRGFTRWIFASQPFYSLPPAPATFISLSSLWSWWLQSSGCCSWRSRNSSCRRTRSWWLPSAPKQWIAQMAGAAPQGGFLLNHRPRHISDACSHTWPYFKCQHCVEDFSDVL